MEQDLATTFMAASEAVRKKVGHLKCPMCGSKQPESNFGGCISQISDFYAYAAICPKCGYVLQFNLKKLLAE